VNADMISSVFDNMVSKGADGPQSLAMATWQICGGPEGATPEMPDIAAAKFGEPIPPVVG